MHRPIITARIWVYWREGHIKLSLRDGETITLYRSSRHDEGWSSYGEAYTRDGDTIVRHTWSDGTDCDGRTGSEHWDTCDADDTRAVPMTRPLTRREHWAFRDEPWEAPYRHLTENFRPAWQPARSSRQFDTYAEAAGY